MYKIPSRAAISVCYIVGEIKIKPTYKLKLRETPKSLQSQVSVLYRHFIKISKITYLKTMVMSLLPVVRTGSKLFRTIVHWRVPKTK